MKQEHIDLYHAKAKEHGFTPNDTATEEGQQEAARYLLVCGFIPFTKENVKLTGNIQFYISAENLPDFLRRTILRRTQEQPNDWTFDEEVELEVTAVGTPWIEGVWIRNGVVIDAKVVRRRDVKVQTTYHSQKINHPITRRM